MTKRQEELYVVIKQFINDKGYSPTVRELGAITKKSSPATTFNKLRALKVKGYITYEEGKARTIKILK